MRYKIPNLSELKTPPQFIAAFVIAPADGDTLDLTQQVYARTSYELSEAFFRIPHPVTSIDLSYNNLGMMNKEELEEIFSHLSSSVTTLQTKGNGFCFPLEEFKEVFKAMKHINLVQIEEHDDDLKKIGSAEDIADMFASFTDKTIQLQGDSPFANKIMKLYSNKKQTVINKDSFFQAKVEPNEKNKKIEDPIEKKSQASI
ncbi:MAG: hypothetical protein H0U70_01025 [Tatlockia sp.]|nr:hypothetical protein [Tatlockia sp.]